MLGSHDRLAGGNINSAAASRGSSMGYAAGAAVCIIFLSRKMHTKFLITIITHA